MFIDYPKDEDLFRIGSQFMFGDNILVAPKLSDGEQIAYLP